MSTNPSHSTGTGTSSASAAAPLAGGAPAPTSTHGAGASSGTGSTVPGTHSGTVPAAASSFPSSGAGASAGASTGTGTGSSGTQSLSTSEAQPQAIPGQAGMDPEIPRTADEAPVFGVEAAKDVPFGEQVKGHAKYFAGKVFGRDHEVQQGAARVRGESHTLPEEVKHPRTKQAEAEAAKGGAQTQGGI